MSIWRPAGPVLTNFDYDQIGVVTTAMTAQLLYLTSIELPAGFPVTTLWWRPGTTAITKGTTPHYWLALYDASRNLIFQSTDDTNPTIGASTPISKALASGPYIVPDIGQFYVGIMVDSDTGHGGVQPTMSTKSSIGGVMGETSVGGGKFNGTSSTGVGATAPNPAGAITGAAAIPWVGVS